MNNKYVNKASGGSQISNAENSPNTITIDKRVLPETFWKGFFIGVASSIVAALILKFAPTLITLITSNN